MNSVLKSSKYKIESYLSFPVLSYVHTYSFWETKPAVMWIHFPFYEMEGKKEMYRIERKRKQNETHKSEEWFENELEKEEEVLFWKF